MDKQVINARSLAIICQAVLNDLKKLADCTSFTTVTVGEGYMLQPITLQGLRHFVTGRSRLAGMVEDSLINLFDFKIESEMLSLDQDFYLSSIRSQSQDGGFYHNMAPKAPSNSNYPKMRFFTLPAPLGCETLAQQNDNNATTTEERYNFSML